MDPTTHRLIAAAGSGQIRDTNFKNTVLLLHGDGTNGAQNNTFIDGSTNNFTITRNGNTTQGSFSPYGDRWSNYFDGTGDYLSTPDSNALDITTEDFTIETWFYVNAFPASSNGESLAVIANKGGVQGSVVPNYGINFTNSSGNIKLVAGFFNGSGSVLTLTGATTIQVGRWYHLAVVRSGNTGKIYLDGAQDATGTLTGNLASNANPFYVGYEANAISRFYFNGYISNLRFIKGTGPYDATQSTITVPTAPLTAITNTSLLTCQSNRFVDNSATPLTLTRNGDVRVTNFNPFGLASPYATGTDGGSGYFDGNTDWLEISNSTSLDLANDFTVEAWVFCTSSANNSNVITGKWAGTGYAWVVGVNPSTGVVTFGYGNSGTYVGGTDFGTSFSPNKWTHVALTRASNTVRVFVDGAQVGTSPTISSNLTATATTYIGRDDGTTRQFNGYISNLRIVKGTAVYTGAFTPPTLKPLAASGADSAACYPSTTNVNTTFAGSNTSLLLNFTNAGIYDQTKQNVLETVGHAQISTTQKKFGTGALYFDGTGDGLKTPNSPNLSLGTGDFTIELWVYPESQPGAYNALIGTSASGGPILTLAGSGTSTACTFNSYGLGFIFNINYTFTQNTWYHIAVTRSGTNVRLFINGTQTGSTVTNSTNFSGYINEVGMADNGNQYFKGYIDDLRITKGVARYTAAFTPPAAPYPDF